LNTIVEAEKPPNNTIKIISSIVLPDQFCLIVCFRLCDTESKNRARDIKLNRFQDLYRDFFPLKRQGYHFLGGAGIDLPDIEN
jgi:hypothetical protein